MKTSLHHACLGLLFVLASGSAASQSDSTSEYCLSGVCLGDSVGQHDIDFGNNSSVASEALAARSYCDYRGPLEGIITLDGGSSLKVLFGGKATPAEWQGYKIVAVSRVYPDVVSTQLDEWKSMVSDRYPNSLDVNNQVHIVYLMVNEKRFNLEPDNLTALYATTFHNTFRPPKLLLYHAGFTRHFNANSVPECVSEKEKPLSLD